MIAPNNLRIGYVATSQDLSGPGDARRFCGYANRRGIPFEIAREGRSYDLVVVTDKGDLSYWARYPRPARIVYDIMDAYLAVPMTEPKGLLRGIAKYVVGQSRSLFLDHRKAIAQMCRRADAVIINTSEQRERVNPHCPNTHLIHDIQSVYRSVKSDYAAGPVFNIVWEGLPENLAPFAPLAEVFSELDARHPIALHVVTKPAFKRYMGKFFTRRTSPIVSRIHKRATLHDWNPDTVGDILTRCDLAVIPLSLADALSRGKSANKLFVFWRMGIPAVTSATPAYRDAMRQAGLSMTCRTNQEWHDTLLRYIEDAAARRTAGLAGRRFVETRFGEERILRAWDDVLTSALSARRIPAVCGTVMI